MKKTSFLNLLVIAVMFFSGCSSPEFKLTDEDLPIDKNATAETKALYYNLRELAKTKVLYGHEDDLAYGYSLWAETLLKGLKANDMTRKMTYVQVWRNANKAREHHEHFYVPYPGQKSATDFVTFKEDNFVLFEDELPDLYKHD